MNKIIIILIMIVFAGCAQKQDIIVEKKIYPNISKNAIFDAAKTLFTISNENNANKSFIIDAYRDKLEVSKVIFEHNVIKVDVTFDKWQLELYQTEKETRANLIMVRRDGIDENEIIPVDKNVVKLFWDRLDYLLGLKKDWPLCGEYFNIKEVEIFNFTPKYSFCSDYFINSIPDNKYIEKNILMSEQEINKNTIDTVEADIYQQTGLKLEKSDDDLFNQNENIEDTRFLIPVMTDNIFETEAQKKAKVDKTENNIVSDKLGFKDLKDGEVLDVDKQMNKFKKDLEDIINVKPQNENREFNLKPKENN
jgi:hypothetical protein